MNKCLNFNIFEILILKRKEKCKFITKNKESFILGCRLSGKSTFFFDGKNITVKRGDILYIPKGSSYSQICVEREEIVCFHLDVFGSAPKEICLYTPSNRDEVCGFFEKAYKLWTKKEKNFEYTCMSLLYAIISRCDFIMQADESSIIKKSVDYINVHLSDTDLSLAYASKLANVSRAYFNRIFIKEYGTTPVKYIQKKRIEKAMLLIGSGDYTREEIATLCGFKDIKYFYTVFKKVTGVTTKEYGLNRTLKTTAIFD